MALAARAFLLQTAPLLRQPGVVAALQIRRKSRLARIRNSEEEKAYVSFRSEISKARKTFQDEWKSQQQMKMEGSNVQAAEEARLEREREERALEENQIELERMRIEREKKNAILAKMKEERRERGVEVRHKVEEKQTKQRATIVRDLEEQSCGFITMENLDEKIQEAIDYEVDYNFALTTHGKKITS